MKKISKYAMMFAAALTLTFSGPENAETFSYWIHNEWDHDWKAGGERHTFLDRYDDPPPPAAENEKTEL